MSDCNGICEYVLDPDNPETWGGKEGDECYIKNDVLNEDGVWTCPHDAEENEDLCIFHLPVEEKYDKETAAAFVNVLNNVTNTDTNFSEERLLQFLGAQFGEFDLSENPPEVVAEDAEVVLSHAVVGSELNWSEAVFEVSGMRLRGFECRKDSNFSGTEFGGKADFLKAEFGGEANFFDAEFGGKALFSGTKFDTGVTLMGTQFNREADFYFAEFSTSEDDSILFLGAKFCGEASFIASKFEGKASFSTAYFSGEANFGGAYFYGKVDFWNTDFNKKVSFFSDRASTASKPPGGYTPSGVVGGARFDKAASFEMGTFDEEASFLAVEFDEEASFVEAQFNGETKFGEVQFNGEANFSNTTFDEGPDFSSINSMCDSQFCDADLTDADFTGVTLHNADFENALLSRATLLGADFRGAKLAGAVLGDVRIDEDTQFLGHPDDDSDLSPHTFSAMLSTPRCVYDPMYEEDNDEVDDAKGKSVYRALEELSGKAARTRLQSQCFVRRQDLQKREYKRVMFGKDNGQKSEKEYTGNEEETTYGEQEDTEKKESTESEKESPSLEERLIAGARYGRTKVARMTLLYGESPWRIIGGSMGFITFAALLYPLNDWLRPTGGEPITYSRILSGEWGLFLESLYFSTLTFTTLGMGDYEPMGLGQVIATLNTTLGAVLIALLVFVFGRRAAR